MRVMTLYNNEAFVYIKLIRIPDEYVITLLGKGSS